MEQVSVSSSPLAGAAVLQTAALLLDYPGPRSSGDVRLFTEVVASLSPGRPREALSEFLDWWAGLSDRQREVQYVGTFDMCAKNSLYLFARREGDKRGRGRALLELKDTYRDHGLEPTTNESPDYLPLVLEFAARNVDGRRILARERPALESLGRSLRSLGSPFAAVVTAILATVDDRPPRGHGHRGSSTEREMP